LFLLKDATEGKEILDHIGETNPPVDLHDHAPSRGDYIEWPRTIISKVWACFSNLSKILLKVPLLNSENLREREPHVNPTLDSLMVFSSELSSRPCLEGGWGRSGWKKRLILYDLFVSTTISQKRYCKKAHLVPVSR
jgi:hypothetical protein